MATVLFTYICKFMHSKLTVMMDTVRYALDALLKGDSRNSAIKTRQFFLDIKNSNYVHSTYYALNMLKMVL